MTSFNFLTAPILNLNKENKLNLRNHFNHKYHVTFKILVMVTIISCSYITISYFFYLV